MGNKTPQQKRNIKSYLNEATVTIQSGDRPICSLLGAPLEFRHRPTIERAVKPQWCPGGARSISHRSPANFRSKLGKIGGASPCSVRAVTDWCGVPPIPVWSPTGHQPIFKKSPIADQFWTHRPVTNRSLSGDRRRPLGSRWSSGFDFWPKSLNGERSIRSVPGRSREYFGWRVKSGQAPPEF